MPAQGHAEATWPNSSPAATASSHQKGLTFSQATGGGHGLLSTALPAPATRRGPQARILLPQHPYELWARPAAPPGEADAAALPGRRPRQGPFAASLQAAGKALAPAHPVVRWAEALVTWHTGFARPCGCPVQGSCCRPPVPREARGQGGVGVSEACSEVGERRVTFPTHGEEAAS